MKNLTIVSWVLCLISAGIVKWLFDQMERTSAVQELN